MEEGYLFHWLSCKVDKKLWLLVINMTIYRVRSRHIAFAILPFAEIVLPQLNIEFVCFDWVWHWPWSNTIKVILVSFDKEAVVKLMFVWLFAITSVLIGVLRRFTFILFRFTRSRCVPICSVHRLCFFNV